MTHVARGIISNMAASGTAQLMRDWKRTSALALMMAGLTLTAPAGHAAPPLDLPIQDEIRAHMDERGLVRKSDIQSGSLLIETDQPGAYVEAPLVAGHVDMQIAGPIIRTTLTQRFTNPSQDWVEGTYVFPLPETAGVDTLKIIIGDRFIEGQIKERGEARQIYEEARENGQRAGLVEQERPNMFTTSVANIGPGETVAIQIEYQDKPSLIEGVWTTRFPMVVAPRYIPETQVYELASNGGQPVLAIDAPVPDAARISPPVLHPDHEKPEIGLRLPMQFDIRLDAGFEIDTVSSPSHNVVVTKLDADTAFISLRKGEVAADRDFVLSWEAEENEAPQLGLFQQTFGEDEYLLAYLSPPSALQADQERPDRETIFVIDNSGSMSGLSMTQAKLGVFNALSRLTPEDEFNIIRFDDTHEKIFPDAMPATKANIEFAKQFVASLSAEGGTEMLPALVTALQDDEPDNDDELRQVVFITDGAIGNEDQLFSAISRGLGRSRLFTVGIGSAPNSHFMTRAARMGRGSFTYINDVSQVAEQSERLFRALEHPAMTDIQVDFPAGASVEAYPSPLPDLYVGEPIMLIAKADDLKGELTFSGKIGKTQWIEKVSLSEATSTVGVSQLWGRAKIADIEESRFEGADYERVNAGVLKTALAYNLVSRLTSLVAVDVTPARPASADYAQIDIANMLPDGWNFAAVFGDDAELRARRMDQLPDNVLQAIADRAAKTHADAGLPLPQTAIGWQALSLIGLGLCLLGLVVVRRGSKR